MDKPRQCTQCGDALSAYAVEGLCGNCLLKPGLEPIPELRDERVRDKLGAVSEGTFTGVDGANEVRRFGDYELLEEIARGGMGVVYRARQLSLDRIVAVKMILAGPFASQQIIQRFRGEVTTAALLQHPNIVAIHDVGIHDDQHYFSMDYVEGQNLSQLVGNRPLPPATAARYVKVIAEAIHYAHQQGILHRDLKPSNVLVDANDQPRITDFGLAKRLDGDATMTVTGQMLGSPHFMPPEQASSERGKVGRHSDVYGLGAILYHLLTARPPFQAESFESVITQVLDTEPVSPRLLNSSVPADLETICVKCLQKEPPRRYQSAQELADELGRFLRDEPILARPVTPLENAWRWCRRKPALASLGASLVLVFTLGFSGTLWQWRQAVDNAQAEAKQRHLADQNLQKAEENRQLADENRELIAQNLYDADMKLAQVEWDEGDLGRTLGLLEAHQPQAGEKDRRSFEWYYFRKLCDGDQRMTLRGHSQTVSCVAFSPDGKRLATGSVGDSVQIWDRATGTRLTTLPEQDVVSLAFAPDGQTLGVGGRDQVVIWNLPTGRAVFKREEALARFRIAFSSMGTLVVIGKRGGPLFNNGGSAELWDYITGELKHVLPESGGYIALSPRRQQLATGNWNQTIKIWDLPSGKFVRSLKTGEVLAMAFSPDGQVLATSYWGPGVNLWDVTTGVQIGSLTNNHDRVWSLAFSPDGTSLATGGADQMVRLWDVATRRQAEQLKGHGNEVVSVAFSADGQTLVSGSRDKKAMLWSVHPIRAMTKVSYVTSRPVFSPNGQLVAAGIDQNRVAVWDVPTFQLKATFPEVDSAVAFSPDGSALLTRGTNYFLRSFDVVTGIVRDSIPLAPGQGIGRDATLSPNGQILVAKLNDGTLMFSDAKTGGVLAVASNTNVIYHFAFSPNGRLLAAACAHPQLGGPAAMIWDVLTPHKPVAELNGHTDIGLSVGFSPDGKTLATSSADNSIRFWDTTTWKEIPPALGQKQYVTSLVFSPIGRTLATACSDGTMKLWSAVTRRELASIKLEPDGRNLTFSPDGQTLAVRSTQGLLVLWRAPVLDKGQARLRDN